MLSCSLTGLTNMLSCSLTGLTNMLSCSLTGLTNMPSCSLTGLTNMPDSVVQPVLSCMEELALTQLAQDSRGSVVLVASSGQESQPPVSRWGACGHSLAHSCCCAGLGFRVS